MLVYNVAGVGYRMLRVFILAKTCYLGLVSPASMACTAFTL